MEENDDEKNFLRKKNLIKKSSENFDFNAECLPEKMEKNFKLFSNTLKSYDLHEFSNKTKRNERKNVTFHHSIPSSSSKSLINSFEIHFFLQ